MSSRRKHRNKKENLTTTADREREKIKESVLQIFRNRLLSPGGGGAILVGKNVEAAGKNPVSIASESKPDGGSWSWSSMSDRDDTDSQKSCSRRRKRTRKERDRKKSKNLPHKIGKSTSGKQEVSRPTGMAQACTTSHMHSLRSTSSSVTDSKVSIITKSRITNKLGLFNQGKKSEKIARGPIPVPESVMKETEKDLKKILSHSEDDVNWSGTSDKTKSSEQRKSIQLPENDCYGGALPSASNSCSSHRSTSRHITPLSAIENIRNRYTSSSAVSISSCISTEDIANTLPQSPPLEDIADTLLSTLKPKRFFLGRNLLRETTQDLCALMKRNTPRSATPTPNSSKMVSSESVKRSLIDRFPPDHKQGVSQPTATVKDKDGVSVHAVRESSQMESRNTELMQKTLPKDELDATRLLKHNDYIINSSAASSQHSEPMETDQSEYNALQILKNNDASSTLPKTSSGNAAVSLNTKSKYDYRPGDGVVIVSNTCNSQPFNKNSHSSGYHHKAAISAPQQHAVSQPKQENLRLANKAVVTEYLKHPEYMPRFHGDYYKDTLEVDAMAWMHYETTVTETDQHNLNMASMDILDYLDEDGRKLDPLTSHSESRIMKLKAATPDSDGSPVWHAPEPPPLPPKPNMDCLSPPQKLYPQRLF